MLLPLQSSLHTVVCCLNTGTYTTYAGSHIAKYVVGQPGICGVLYLTYCVLGQTKCVSRSMEVWVLERAKYYLTRSQVHHFHSRHPFLPRLALLISIVVMAASSCSGQYHFSGCRHPWPSPLLPCQLSSLALPASKARSLPSSGGLISTPWPSSTAGFGRSSSSLQWSFFNHSIAAPATSDTDSSNHPRTCTLELSRFFSSSSY